MSILKVIKTEPEYDSALKRLEKIQDAIPNTPEGDELELLALLIEYYENKNYSINMEYNKQNFWDNTQGVFPIKLEGEFNDLVSFAVNEYSKEKGFEVNFNESGDSFYVRTRNFAVRISSNWGYVGNCFWGLERDPDPGKFQLVVINYSCLSPKVENWE